MNEETVFAEAIAIESPEERSKFLDSACAEDLELRKSVEKLLCLAADAGSFLEHPPLEAAAGALHGIDATILRGDGSTCDEGEASYPGPLDMSPSPQEHDEQIPLGYLKPATRQDSLGRLGHYEVLEVVGRGAFGTVLRAFDEKLERIVAIKVLAPEMAATSPARKRFLREARTSAAVRHENVVAIYAVEDDPIPFLVMEYIPGETLQKRLDDHGPLDVLHVLKIGKQIADGLAAAHAQDLIHRDIKPGNILLESSLGDRVKITDFGLARTADDASMTQSGMIAGTPMYMAPEQAEGAKLDQRADLFSFGSVLYQMLSGRPPFRAANTVAVLKRVVDDTPRPIREIIPEVPIWMCELVGHLQAKNPDERYGSAKEVSDLLGRCQAELQAGRQPQIPSPSMADTVFLPTVTDGPRARQCASNKKPGRIAAMALVLLVALGIAEATGVTHLATTVIRLATGSGTLVIETDDPGLKVAIDGEEVAIRGGGVEELTLRPGEYKVAALKNGEPVKQELVTITRNNRTVVRISLEDDGRAAASADKTPADLAPKSASSKPFQWPADAPPPAIAPFDAAQAKAHQQAWAKYLGVPVEYENSLGMKFRLIPPGEFLMGSTSTETAENCKLVGADEYWQLCINSEDPQHKVILSEPTFLGVYEVTQAEYEKVMGKNPSLFAKTGIEKGFADKVNGLDTLRHPVESVSWNDAAQFCAKLSNMENLKPISFESGTNGKPQEGNGYCLPTEAQWEFSCRAGTITRYCTGNKVDFLQHAAWFEWNSEGRTHKVGSLKPNPFGFHDMHGNVWEWVQDSWDPKCYEQFKTKPALDPCVQFSNDFARVMRGGDWRGAGFFSRSAIRYGADAWRNSELWGFRVSLSVDAVKQQ